jgi:ABC-type transporter Mla subunit MlaD
MSESTTVEPTQMGSVASTDWERKFKGQTRKVAKLTEELKQRDEELNALRKTLDELRKAQEEAQTKLSETVQRFESQIKELTERAAEQERAAQKAKQMLEIGNLIDQKFPHLKPAFTNGDLKDRDQFASDEDYTAYLERMAGLVQAPKPAEQPPAQQAPQQSKVGYVPSASPTSRPAGVLYTRDSLMEELDKLDSRVPEQAARIREIYSLLDQLQGGS